MAIACRIALGILFVTAGGAKARNSQAFAQYLQEPFGRAARWVAVAVVVIEVVMGLVIWVAGIHTSLLVLITVFIGGASLVYAFRLSLADRTTCHCWGSSDTRSDADTANMLWPAVVGARNSAILLAAWGAYGTGGVGVRAGILLAPLAFVTGGLLASIVLERRRLRLPTHPRRRVFEPQLRRNLMALRWYEGSD